MEFKASICIQTERCFYVYFSYLWKQGLTKERLVFHKAVNKAFKKEKKNWTALCFAAYMKTVSVATCQTHTFSKFFPIYAYSCYCTTLWANNTPGSSLCFPCIGYAQVQHVVLYPSYQKNHQFVKKPMSEEPVHFSFLLWCKSQDKAIKTTLMDIRVMFGIIDLLLIS